MTCLPFHDEGCYIDEQTWKVAQVTYNGTVVISCHFNPFHNAGYCTVKGNIAI